MSNILSILHTHLIVVLAFCAVFLITVAMPGILTTGYIGNYRRKKLMQMEQMHKNLFVSGHSAKQQRAWLEWGCVLVALVCLFLTGSVLVSLLVVLLLWQIPDGIYWYLAKNRREQFDEQLPVALDQLTSATRAGKSLSQAISDVSAYAPHPVSQELGQIANDQRLGIDLTTALKSARDRVNSKSFNLIVTAMLVNIDLGGNLPQAMEVMSGSLKEIWRLDQKLHTASAEGRKGGTILCVMPIVILMIVLVMQPELISILFSSVIGYLVLFLAVSLYFMGLFWMYRILQVDI